MRIISFLILVVYKMNITDDEILGHIHDTFPWFWTTIVARIKFVFFEKNFLTPMCIVIVKENFVQKRKLMMDNNLPALKYAIVCLWIYCNSLTLLPRF